MAELIPPTPPGDPSLTALIDRAGQRLRNARTSAEVFEARKLADMALHYATITRAANETRADCLRIVVMAETRLADEVDAAQDRGEVASAGDNPIVRGSDNQIARVADLGLTRQRLNEWRQVRDAGQETVEHVLADAVAAGRTPTKSEILQAARALQHEQTLEKQIRRDAREHNEGTILATENASRRLQEREFGVIYSDPPPDHETWSAMGRNRSPGNSYSTVPFDTVRELRPPAAKNCVLYQWSPGPFISRMYALMEEWGYATDKTPIIWKKPHMVTGYWTRVDAEFLLIGTLGKPVAPAPGTQMPTIIEAAPDDNRPGRKPAIFAELIASCFPNTPKLEMYARPPFRPGWTYWGNEVPDGMLDVP
jgi:N6-adenosine-specific RNA methylase IME4